ncbi:MAG: hypothetical protein LUC95_11480, partial [Lachnospiraceae bacterium]|nr:hypothetical protein [Lachnospiraceae bacterium]
SGDIPPNPSELLTSDRMQTVLRMLEETFDYVILDLPPIGIVSDALGVTKYTDGLLFVVREDMYDKKMMNESMRTLNGVDAHILGMVVTHSTTQQKEYRRYGNKYGGKYGSKYGYQYGYQYGYGRTAAEPLNKKTDRSQSTAARTVEPEKEAQPAAKSEAAAKKAPKGAGSEHGAGGQETKPQLDGAQEAEVTENGGE